MAAVASVLDQRTELEPGRRLLMKVACRLVLINYAGERVGCWAEGADPDTKGTNANNLQVLLSKDTNRDRQPEEFYGSV